MRTILNWFTYQPKTDKKARKKLQKPSMTVPDQAISIRKILEQHSRGMPLPPDVKGQYFGDINVPDFDSMDLSEIYDYKKDLQETIEYGKKEIKDAQDAHKAAEQAEKQQQQAEEPPQEE